MDWNVIALLIPIMALGIPIVAIVNSSVQKLANMRLEEARLRAGAPDAGRSAELEVLRAEVADLRQELADMQERLDFTERVLAQSREGGRLPGGNAT